MKTYTSLETFSFQASSISILQEQLTQHFSLASETEIRSSFLLFWGPADAPDRKVLGLIASVPPQVPTIGASSGQSFVNDQAIDSAHWGALCIRSEYLKATAAAAHLDLREGVTASAGCEKCVNDFVNTMKKLKLADYFRDGKPQREIRKGAHGVSYRRPAFLLLFLPGMGIGGPLHWPVSNKDYLLIEFLSSRVSRTVGVFGGSAASHPRKNGTGWARPWLAAKGSEEKSQPQFIDRGLVGLLVETDLAFGFACKHDFVSPQDAPFYQVFRERMEERAGDVPERGKLDRYHRVGVSLEGANLPGLLAFGSAGGTTEIPWQGSPDCWNTLVVFEEGERIPCPPYRSKDDRYEFLRPLSAGMPLYPATVMRECPRRTIPEAVCEAKDNGEVRMPEVAIVMNCKGRLLLFGKEGNENEFKLLKRDFPDLAIIGMCMDGESCPSSRGTNLHRNWTASVLVLGRDYNRRYADKARMQLLGKMDQNFMQLGLIHGLDSLVKQARTLMQIECVHIRMEDEENGEKVLRKVSGVGEVFSAVPKDYKITGIVGHSNSIAVHSYISASDQTIPETRAQFIERVTGCKAEDWMALDLSAKRKALSHWENPEKGVELLDEYEWWFAKAIRAGEQRLGVLVLASRDKTYYTKETKDDEAAQEFERGLAEFTSRAAVSLSATLQQKKFIEVLNAVVNAPNQLELGLTIVKGGQSLLGPKAYLGLFLPEPGGEKETKRLVYKGGGNLPKGTREEDFYVLLGNEASIFDKGVCGWMFENGIESIIEHDIHAPTIINSEGGPKYKPGFGNIGTEYAFLLQERSGEAKGKRLGVLNAEAPPNVLDGRVHVEMLSILARACTAALSKYDFEAQTWRQMGTLLPRHILEHLKSTKGKGFDTLGPPTQKIVTILYGDIRGFTRMSQIVGEKKMVSFIQDYYNLVAECVSKSRGGGRNGKRGTLDKFMGDGFIAFFGDYGPERLDAPYLSVSNANEDLKGGKDSEDLAMILDAIERAIGTALDIGGRFRQELAESWLPRWRYEFPEVRIKHPLEMGLAVHTGTPIVGLFRAGKGDEAHLTYTGIGRDVNLAARVCDRIAGNTVWVTATTWQYLRHSIKFNVSATGRLLESLKGMSDIEVFEVKRR